MPYTIDLTEDGHLDWPPHRDEYPHQRLMTSSEVTWRKTLLVLAKGPVHDKSGTATAKLAKRVKWDKGPTGFTQVLGTMEHVGLIQRETRGKRTFAIALAVDVDQLPVEWFPAPSTNGHSPDATDAGEATEAEAAQVVPPDATEAHTATPDHFGADHLWSSDANEDGVDYSLLATALLERVVELVSGATAFDPDAYDKSTVLSVQLSHANNQAEKLRKRVNVLERDLTISAGMVKSYRVRLAEEERLHRGTEANMQHALSTLRKLDANAKLNEDQRTALAKMLREIPRSPDTQRNIT